jgi:preprotein translocase subunit SecF
MASKAKTRSGAADEVTTGAVELTETSGTVDATDLDTAAQLPHHNFFSRLYTGTGAFEVVGRRRLWYGVGLGIVAIAVASIVIRGFTFGIDFKGGTTVSFPRGNAGVPQVEEVFRQTIGMDAESVVIVGNGSLASVQIRSKTLPNDQTAKLRNALFDRFQPKGTDGKPSKQAISDSAVSSTWGGQITKKALIALVVFLVLVALYITVRYERYMAISALATMCFDLTVTAGVYSLVGFEVTPATVIGLLTILGFSLYDTVIVFDKVEENTHGFHHTTRRTFAEQANLAINQTFMRSINTSLISVLPVTALMVVAVWLLGVGTLKDLALVELVGIIVGTYSSIFFATPLLVSLRERTEMVRTHTRRVLRRRNAGSEKGSEKASEKGPEPAELADDERQEGTAETAATSVTKPAPSKPAPGARPARATGSRHRRPTGKRNAGRR